MPTPSNVQRLFGLVATQPQSLVIFFPSSLTTLNRKAVSSHVSHIPHVDRQVVSTPSNVQRLFGLVATQPQSLVIFFPSSLTTLNRNAVSSQDDASVGGDVVVSDAEGDGEDDEDSLHSE